MFTFICGFVTGVIVLIVIAIIVDRNQSQSCNVSCENKLPTMPVVAKTEPASCAEIKQATVLALKPAPKKAVKKVIKKASK